MLARYVVPVAVFVPLAILILLIFIVIESTTDLPLD